MDDPYEKWGPQHFAETVERSGHDGDPDRLSTAMAAASSFGLTPPQLANAPEIRKLFCSVVRGLLRRSVSDQVIVTALLALSRTCPYCDEECWEWCDKCAGCPTCCESEYHCAHCGN